jgi:serine/threonine protein kinase
VTSGLVIAGKYHVVQPIGQGGMGAVYDAVHAKTGRRVALKLIHEATIAKGGPAARMRFEREARSAAAIDSLHVVQIIDSGEDDRSGLPYIVMEHLEGQDLKKLLERGPLPPSLAVAIAAQICLGLKKAHEGEVIHRDLKPGNVFLAKADGERRLVKILDFGIAKIASDGNSESAKLTATSDVIGSPPYMSPEQLRSPRDVDHRTDLWSLGVVLYEMLTGRLPTTGTSPIGALVYAICHVPAPPVRDFAPAVSPELAAVVHRALEIDPNARFRSADEMYAALAALAPAGTEITERDLAPFAPDGDRAPEIASSQTATDLVKTLTQETATLEETSRALALPTPQRQAPPRRLGWIAVVAALCASGIIGTVVLQRRSAPATTDAPVSAGEIDLPEETAPAPASADPIASAEASDSPRQEPPTSNADAPKPRTPPRPAGGRRAAPRSKPRTPPAPSDDSRARL